MTISLRAALDGLRRAFVVRKILAWLWLANLAFALPFAAVVSGAIRSSIGPSQIGEQLLEGFNLLWYTEYQARSRGIAGSLEPSQIGVGAFVDNIELWWTGELFVLNSAFVGAGLLYAVLWAFLLGGALVFLHSREPHTFREFAGFCGEFFLRFVRLSAVMAVAYYLVYRFARWLFGRVEWSVRDVTVEKTVLLYYLAAALLIVTLLAVVRMAADYAKISIVLEDRRSALLAALRGFRFVARHPFRTMGLLLWMTLLGAAVLWLYHAVAPGVDQASWAAVFVAFLIGQAVLALRLGLRLALLGGEVELYELSALSEPVNVSNPEAR